MALADTREQPRVAVVLAPQAQTARADRQPWNARASICACRQTQADQLGTTHLLAARGYDTVVAVGLDRRIALDPVAARYPGTRFVEARPDARAIARAAG